MHARLFVAGVVVLGFVEWGAVEWGALGFRVSAAQYNPTIAGDEDCALLPVPVPAPPNPPATVVMCGLDNPRGLAFSQFALYVAEAGRGGLGLVTPNCFAGQAGGTRCYAPNGAITRLWNGVQEQIATGFPSHANLMGRQAIGPHDIALVGGAGVTIGLLQRPAPDDCHPACAYVTIGLQQPPVFRDRHPFLADFAKLARVLSSGEWSYVADLGAYETERDPDQSFYDPDKLDTNPYGLLAAPGAGAVVAIDAGGNSALLVGADGEVSTLAAFGPHPDDSVPTSIDAGPDGAYYVGELTGFPVVLGAANILRVDRASGSTEMCLTGFTTIIDIAFDKQGNLYVLEYAGSLIRVVPERRAARERDDRSVICAQYAAGDRTTMVSGLTNPTSVVVGPDGALYVSNRGIFPMTGEVIRFELAK
jgi:hypothetical protein